MRPQPGADDPAPRWDDAQPRTHPGATHPRALEGALLIAVLLLAFAVRTVRLDAQSLWYDEAVSAQVAAKGLAELARWTADDIQPPLYYIFLAGWTRVAGHGEWALRFPSVFFGTATIALLWSLAQRLYGRGPRGSLVALLTAGMAAIAPLYVYYAQEARMYTQLTFFGALAGYALLRAVSAPEGRRAIRWWAATAMASLAALYTHYFALFLLAAFALCALVALALARGRVAVWQIRNAVATIVLVGLGYLPWLPSMLNRYRVDASYWQGDLKLAEALRHIAISFTTGAPETMLETDAVRWLPWFTIAIALALAGLWSGARQRKETGRQQVWILLLVLLLPVFMVLALAARNPKFNPRYLMMVSPAYLAILAGGMAGWWFAPGRTRLSGRILAIAIAALVLAASAVGLRNWFTDPAFTKAQWRELAAYVREEMGGEERVVLVSGHAVPAWEYYAAEITPLPLPPIDILDVNAVLGFEAAPALEQGLAGKDGAWLVTWQDRVIDPVGFVPYFLDRAGAETKNVPPFWQLGLQHWTLQAGARYPSSADPQHADAANFDHKLGLLGWDDPIDGELTVYWQALNSLPEDYQVSLVLEDASGAELGRWDGRPAGYDYPTTRWSVDRAVFGRYPLPGSAGASGERYVTLAIYAPDAPEGLNIRDVADNPAGKRVRLGPLRF